MNTVITKEMRRARAASIVNDHEAGMTWEAIAKKYRYKSKSTPWYIAQKEKRRDEGRSINN